MKATNTTTANIASLVSVHARPPLVAIVLLAAVSCIGASRRGHRPNVGPEPESCRGCEKASAAAEHKPDLERESAFFAGNAEPYQMETNPSLADDSRYGPLYLPDPNMPENVKDSIRYVRVDERRRTGKNVDHTSSVTIISLKEDEPFTFDDLDIPSHEEIFDRIRDSKWFRVVHPKTEGDPHVIRGFNKFGRIVYYNEWYDVMPDALANGEKNNVRRVKVPEFRVPDEASFD